MFKSEAGNYIVNLIMVAGSSLGSTLKRAEKKILTFIWMWNEIEKMYYLTRMIKFIISYYIRLSFLNLTSVPFYLIFLFCSLLNEFNFNICAMTEMRKKRQIKGIIKIHHPK